jgi:hypothetical protein
MVDQLPRHLVGLLLCHLIGLSLRLMVDPIHSVCIWPHHLIGTNSHRMVDLLPCRSVDSLLHHLIGIHLLRTVDLLPRRSVKLLPHRPVDPLLHYLIGPSPCHMAHHYCAMYVLQESYTPNRLLSSTRSTRMICYDSCIITPHPTLVRPISVYGTDVLEPRMTISYLIQQPEYVPVGSTEGLEQRSWLQCNCTGSKETMGVI